MAEKIHDLSLGGDAVHLTLHSGYTPDIDAHQVWADVSATEYATANGYTANGKILANQDVSPDDGNDLAIFDADDAVWTALGTLSPAIPSHAILWNNTPSSPEDPLIAYIELGVKATNGGDSTVSFNASGILEIT